MLRYLKIIEESTRLVSIRSTIVEVG